MPPEVYGCLSVAENHATTMKGLKTANLTVYHRKRRAKKHEQKIQKLISKAVKYLNNRKETI
jgi:hypothetical protein